MNPIEERFAQPLSSATTRQNPAPSMTFAELLVLEGIDPADVAILRHTGKSGVTGFSPYDLWKVKDGLFDLYQSTQAPSKRRLFSLPIWASFVSTPERETLFVGLYSAEKGDPRLVTWNCPVNGVPPGSDKGTPSDFYKLNRIEALSRYRDELKVEWGKGYVSWDRYGRNSRLPVLTEIALDVFDAIDATREGAELWQVQRSTERSSKIAKAALSRNFSLSSNSYHCEACMFAHPDRAMFDTHHIHPLAGGSRMTQVTDLLVLCPTCHRRAHRSPNRFRPFGLSELQQWNQNGRLE